ncbi:hypothetical protein BC939DRAFT_441285, partial [Gamsiella multidivaricata]|uniref:uncharacterized protein n=1 Tax=Gamsiella multidivaricata TaxID=101098 RepID=UPI00221E8B6C
MIKTVALIRVIGFELIYCLCSLALMNDAFNESSVQGEVAWLKQWSEVVADVEVFYMSNTSHHNHNFFPDYIYYGASEKDAEVYGSQYYIANKSNLSLENRFVVEAVSAEQNTIQMAQRGIIHDVQKMERQQDIATQEIAEMRELMKQTRDELLSEMRRLMAAPANQKNVLTEGNEQSATSSPVTQESSFSKSSRDISSPDREKVIQNKTSSSSVLNQRQQQNLDAIYTADDSRKAQQRLEDNNASHPVYVKPQEHQDNNSDSDDSENEDKNDKSTPYQSSPSHVPRYHSQRDQTQHYPQQQDPPRRAQSDGQLTSLPHEVV